MRVLISPLDWGLGHATRDIPIIRSLQQAGHEVVVLAGGAGHRLLQGEFPDLEINDWPTYTMRYSRSRLLLPLALFAQLPFFLLSIFKERKRINQYVRSHGIDLVISDGRYGLKTKVVPSIFITHQLCILPPGPRWFQMVMAKPIWALNRFALRGFAEIWVPDFPTAINLSGKLGHPPKTMTNVRYIYPLCRFRAETLSWNQPSEMNSALNRIDVLALVSGPEPQRTLLEKILIDALEKISGTRVLVCGKPAVIVGAHRDAPQTDIREGQLTVFDHLPGDQLTELLAAAERIVCRSGYTSVMELAGLGKKNVLFIPTPGQPEQEYLARHLQSMDLAEWQEQEDLDVEGGLKKAAGLPGFAALFRVSDSAAGFPDLARWIQEHPLFHPVKRLEGKFVL